MDFFKKINQITSHLNQILLRGVHAVFSHYFLFCLKLMLTLVFSTVSFSCVSFIPLYYYFFVGGIYIILSCITHIDCWAN
jgi:hypothetical protein